MCGRYATARSNADISAFFDAYDDTPAELAPSWNVAPTDPVPVVRVSRTRAARVVSAARWGLVFSLVVAPGQPALAESRTQ